jgi:hypothetical protein
MYTRAARKPPIRALRPRAQQAKGRDHRRPSALGLSRSSTQMYPRVGTPACLGALRPHRRTARPPPPAQCARQPRMCKRASLKLVIYSPFQRHACARCGAGAQGRPSAPSLRGVRTATAPRAHSQKNRAGPPAKLPLSCGRCSARGSSHPRPPPRAQLYRRTLQIYTRLHPGRPPLARSLSHAHSACGAHPSRTLPPHAKPPRACRALRCWATPGALQRSPSANTAPRPPLPLP